MDPKLPHDLESNEIREFLDNAKDFWDKHGNSILICFIVVVGGYAAYNWYTNWQSGINEDAAIELTAATTPEVLRTVAAEHPPVADEARKRAGDLYHRQAIVELKAGNTEAANEDLKEAAETYQALADSTKVDAYKINAYLGLARVAESREDWDAAEGFYKQAKELAGEKYTTLAGLADSGLETLPTLRHPHPFGDVTAPPQPSGPQPSETPAAGPNDNVPPLLRNPDEIAPGADPFPNPLDSLNPGE